MKSDIIIVHLKNGGGFVKLINAAGLTTKPQVLCDLLNEQIKRYQTENKP